MNILTDRMFPSNLTPVIRLRRLVSVHLFGSRFLSLLHGFGCNQVQLTPDLSRKAQWLPVVGPVDKAQALINNQCRFSLAEPCVRSGFCSLALFGPCKMFFNIKSLH